MNHSFSFLDDHVLIHTREHVCMLFMIIKAVDTDEGLIIFAEELNLPLRMPRALKNRGNLFQQLILVNSK